MVHAPHAANRADPRERLLQIGVMSSITFAVLLVLAAIVATREVVRSLEAVAFEDAADLIAVQNLHIAADVKGRRARSFLLTGNEQVLEGMNAASEKFERRLRKLQQADRADPEDADLLERVVLANRDYQGALDHVIATAKARTGAADARTPISTLFELEVQPAREELDRALIELASAQERRLHEATVDARSTISLSIKVMVAMAGAGLVAALAMGMFLTRALTTLRKQRLEIVRHLAKVEELNVELDAFAGRVAHDLRNLISPLAMSPGLLRRATDDPNKIRSLADRIQRATERSIAMLDGLLAFSRSGAPETQTSTSIASVVEDVIDQLGPLIAERDVTVEREGEDVSVACSRELLSVVVTNLVGNAIKFLEGRPTRAVRIGTRRVGDHCELTVSDTGPGIPNEALSRVFDPFYRVPGTKAKGTGIGLATVRRIIEAHGGHVTAEAHVGRGAVFTVVVPIASEPSPSEGALVAREPTPHPTTH